MGDWQIGGFSEAFGLAWGECGNISIHCVTLQCVCLHPFCLCSSFVGGGVQGFTLKCMVQHMVDDHITLRLGKNELHELRGVQLLFRFSAKLLDYSVKFGFLDVQVRTNFQNSIFISCK